MTLTLDPKDLKFIEKRRWFVNRWNLVGSGMFAALVAFLAWMFVAQPRLVNPLHVMGELQTGAIPQSTLEIMAAMLPIAVMALFIVLATMIGFAFASMGNERRYLKLIDQLHSEQPSRE